MTIRHALWAALALTLFSFDAAADVADFGARLAKESPAVRVGELDGKLPLLIVADPPVSGPDEAAKGNRLVVLAVAGGGTDGQEALLALARDVATAKDRPLLKELVLLIAPTLEGAPDLAKLNTPAAKALARAIGKWDPAVVVECRTADGPSHRCAVTYDGNRCPAGSAKVTAFVRDELLPEVGRRLQQKTGHRSFFVGSFTADRTRWEPPQPTARTAAHYAGLRNRVGVVAEANANAAVPARERVLATRAFVEGVCEYAAANKPAVRKLLTEARESAAKDAGKVVLRHTPAPVGKPQPVLAIDPAAKDGPPREYEVTYLGGAEPTLAVSRPYAYLVPNGMVEALQRHGIDVDELREDVELDVEVCRPDGPARTEARLVSVGTAVVRTAQPLGALAAYLLEPQSPDRLVSVAEGKDSPVMRLPAQVPLTVGRVRPLPEDRTMGKRITQSRQPTNLGGAPVREPTWLDGVSFLQTRDGRPYRVNALTGRGEPCLEAERLLKSMGTSSNPGPGAGGGGRGRFGGGFGTRMGPDELRNGLVIERSGDIYLARPDGERAVRLTETPGAEEAATLSPDGTRVAFVRGNNLYALEVAGRRERALTTDGSALVLNGKPDWVYGEEIFNRSIRALWWSPDSKKVAFLRFDDTKVPGVTITGEPDAKQSVSTSPYPRPGDPNPTVKLGIADATTGSVAWADLPDHDPAATLVTRVGWLPDSAGVYFYVQDRIQSWLDVCTCPAAGGKATKLFRESSKAWIDEPGPLHFLADGSFLYSGVRSGWKHLYHHDRDGGLIGAVTGGPWEVRTLQRVDEKAGLVYFSATCEGSTTLNLYRAPLSGGGPERLTRGAGVHTVRVAPTCDLFLDAHSDPDTPTQLRLCRTDGSCARVLDANPAYTREEYVRGEYQRVKIPTPDGFVLEASVLKPADFDPRRKYPVWYTTYAGPHAPTVRDSYGDGRVADEAKASLGYIVFHCDPRSASGVGASATWTAYRKLGVQELKDIETAIKWLTAHPWVDAKRVGMSGHSYGGFMTAFALTHSKLFAAGIAGSPVTDWRDYDSIYTERYMGLPSQNAEGYDASSVVKAAANLHGKLLIAHGLMDNNVLPRNTIRLVDALQRADKDFEVMLYPRAGHGLAGAHYRRLTFEFMRRHLQPEKVVYLEGAGN